MTEARGLRWVRSPHSDAEARRGFCGECGSSLFWDPPRRDTISIAAGTLDQPTGLRIAAHWFVSQAADYDEVPDDGLPRHERSAERGLAAERGGLAGGAGSGHRRPATSSWPTLSVPISTSPARSVRITARPIAIRPMATAPTAVTAIASGPMLVGPMSRAPVT